MYGYIIGIMQQGANVNPPEEPSNRIFADGTWDDTGTWDDDDPDFFANDD